MSWPVSLSCEISMGEVVGCLTGIRLTRAKSDRRTSGLGISWPVGQTHCQGIPVKIGMVPMTWKFTILGIQPVGRFPFLAGWSRYRPGRPGLIFSAVGPNSAGYILSNELRYPIA